MTELPDELVVVVETIVEVHGCCGCGTRAVAHERRVVAVRDLSVDEHRYSIGGPALLRERGLADPPELDTWTQNWQKRGAAVLYLVRDDTIVGGLALEDEIRPEARDAVRALHSLGRRVVMITGDNPGD